MSISPRTPASPRSPLSLSRRSSLNLSPIPFEPPMSSAPSGINASGDGSVAACKTHERFYFEDPMITFEVESTLFKVHRHFLVRESEVFETMFTLPAAQGEAQVEEHTKLPDVTAAELEALLIFFYDGMHALPQDWKFWSNLLSIATRFCFDKIRQRAISQLASSLTPIEQIYHGKKYDVPDWLREGYQSVCKRSEPLELSEAEKIGWEDAIMLAKAREIYYRTDLQETMDLGSPRPLFSNTSSGMTAFGGNFFQAEITSLSEDDRAARAIDTVFGPLRSVLQDSQPVRNEMPRKKKKFRRH